MQCEYFPSLCLTLVWCNDPCWEDQRLISSGEYEAHFAEFSPLDDANHDTDALLFYWNR